MDDKAALLQQLRIDRGGGDVPSRTPKIIAGSCAVLVLAALAGWWWSRPTGVLVRVVTAQAIAGGNGAAGSSVLDASGYVVARRQATVSSKITGKLVELDIEEGEHVKAGQIIAKLDDSNVLAALNQSKAQLAYAKAGLTETEVNLANAQRDYDRQSALIKDHYVSQAAVDTSRTTLDALRAQLATQKSNIDVAERGLEVAERSLDDTTVRAPFSGVVTVKAAQPGEIVSPISAGGGFTRTGIGTIVDMDSLEIQVDVNENFINRVHSGQRASAKLNAYPDWQIPAHVIAVIPTADRSKGTVTVRIALDQKDARILPEMGVRVAFLDETSQNAEPQPGAASSPGATASKGATASQGATASPGAAASGAVSLPTDAVQVSGSTGVVFVVHDDTVERRAVRLGAPIATGMTIAAGLAAGERVAVGDFAQLRDGAHIQIQDKQP